MVTKVADNIYKKVVPLPNNPLREINAYIIKGEGQGDKNLLIDTGFNRPECEEALKSAFDELGIEKTDVFITHLHSDHCGLVPKFAKEESVIYSGETDGELMNFEAGNLYWRILDDMFLKFGFPKAEFGRNTDIHPGRKYVHDSKIDFTYV
ncbi:MAG: MBL fold metallo-hydrolase, partial [Anaerovoracaceae bacterium]